MLVRFFMSVGNAAGLWARDTHGCEVERARANLYDALNECLSNLCMHVDRVDWAALEVPSSISKIVHWRCLLLVHLTLIRSPDDCNHS